MATADEILEQIENNPELYAADQEEICTIDNDLRTITVPSGLQTVGVESDEDVRRLYFQMPKQYHEVDLSEFDIRINFMNANNQGDVYAVTDKQVAGDNITFSWLVGRNALAYRGNIRFVVCLKKVDAEGTVQQEFNTTVAQLTVLEGLETTEAVVAENPDIIEQILQRLDELEENGGGGSAVPGKDGREIELQNSGTAIQWRYVGDNAWTDLVQLSEITGPKGDPGEDGIAPTIGENGNWYLGEADTGKPSRGERGDPGQKGDPGEKGDPGQTGATPDIQIGTVQTLEPGQQATASLTGTPENPLLNLGIPKGEKGDPGEDATNGIPSGGTSGQVLSKKTDDDYDVEWKDIESSSAGSDLIFTNETNYSASVNDLEEVGENQYIPVTNSLMFIPSLDGVLKVGSENLIGDPYSGSVNELLEPTVSFEKIQDGYSLSYNEEYTGIKNFQSQRFGFSTSLKTGSTYTISLKNELINKKIYVYGCNIENESGDLLGTIQDGKLTFTVSKDYIYIRIPCSDLPENLTEITLTEGEVALEYGGSATEYSVEKDVPLYIKNVKGLNCVGSGKFYAAPFAIVELNNMRTHGSAKTYSTDKYYVNMGDSIWTFGTNTGGIGNISDYMENMCGGTWINICTGGTTMANRPGEYAGEYDALDFHALADCVYSGDFSSAKNSGLTTNLDANVDSIVWDDVDYITVAYGTNDLAFGAELDNSGNLYDKNTVCGALRYGIERINSKYPNIKFKVCGILYRSSDGISISDIVEWNEGIKKACVSVGAEYVDMSCGINGGNRTSFLYDGTHPNANGKEAIAKALAKTIINI